MINKYSKIVYQSNPIGKERIILYLTTFDLEAFEKGEGLTKMPTKEITRVFEYEHQYLLNRPDYITFLAREIESYINYKYSEQLKEMKTFIETLKATNNTLSQMYKEEKLKTKVIKGDVVGVENVKCDVIEGDVVGCYSVDCNEIKGTETGSTVRRERRGRKQNE